MGSLNQANPFDETRHTIIPASPGWFVFEWEGSRTNYKLLKSPIVAWLVETKFYPHKIPGSEQLTGAQGFFPRAYPVTTGGVHHDVHRSVVALGPDGCVYRLNGDGRYWSDIDNFIQHEWDQIEAQEETGPRPVVS